MTARRHFDRVAQPREGEPLVLSPAATYFPATPAPISFEQAEPSPLPAPLAQAPLVAPVLSPVAQRLVARKAASAAPVPARPLAAAPPTMLPSPMPGDATPPVPPSTPKPAVVGQPGAPAHAVIPPAATRSADAPGSARDAVASARAAVYPEIAHPPDIPDPITKNRAAIPQEPELLRPADAPSLAPALPRRPGAALTPHPAPRESVPDFGVPGLAAWLEPARTVAPQTAVAAPAAGGVHIGVVEVRVTPPAPAPPVQHRAPAAAQPALARGYGWRFGLGQG